MFGVFSSFKKTVFLFAIVGFFAVNSSAQAWLEQNILFEQDSADNALTKSSSVEIGQLPPSLTVNDVTQILKPHAKIGEFPSFLEVPEFGYAKVRYTLDEDLHNSIGQIYQRYKPDYASFVAIEPETGKILALSSFTREPSDWQNLALGSSYPAASIFKIITAAAALDSGEINIDTVIPFNGKSTTLYKRQTLAHKDNKYTRTPTFKEAFAKSTNPVFGRVSVKRVGKELLLNYVEKFGFGKRFAVDLELGESQFLLPLIEEWELAEAGSGFTRDILIGPLHAAQMMASIYNEGLQVSPYVVDNIVDTNNEYLYQYQPALVSPERIIGQSAVKDLKLMMKETVRIGSARKSFNRAHRYKAYRGLEYGGKTGSLSGLTPKGRYDWFVGFAEKEGKKIVYASLIINKEKWYVKSSRVAFEVLNKYFKQEKPLVAD